MENYRQMVIPITLKGMNYLLWSRMVKTALGGRGLWNHIGLNSSEVAVVDQEKWIQEDQFVLSILQSSLDNSILEAYSYCETPKELWDTLNKVYGNTSNLSRVFEVKKAINSLQQEDMEFTSHYGKFRSLWAELEMLRPFSIDPEVLHTRREQDKVFGLLMTLNSNYNDLIKHILRGEKLPSLEDVCSQIQKEQGSNGLFGKSELITSNIGEVATANKGAYKYHDRKQMVCDHCKKRGHHKDKCWIKHPHLKPIKFREGKANTLVFEGGAKSAKKEEDSKNTANQTPNQTEDRVVMRSELDALIKALKENSGNIIARSFHATYNASLTTKPMIVDSGASHHMISDANLITNIEPALGNVVIANGDKIPIKGIGKLKLFDKESKAFYMPSFTSNLISVKRATTDLQCRVIFSPDDVYFQDIESSKLLGKGGTRDGLYLLEEATNFLNSSSALNSLSDGIDSSIWHARLGHPHNRALNLMLPNIVFQNIDCEACILGKHCKSVYPKSMTIYENCFDLVHSDVWTAPCMSRDNHRYFVTFIDEKSKYTWVTLMPSKDKVFSAFINFQNYITNHFNARIKILRTDNGGEYTSKEFTQHLQKQGIIHQTSCPYNPQQNGVAERKNRHLMEVARSMMFHSHVPKRFWGDAVLSACYLINRIPTQILKDASPFQVLNNTKPPLDHLRVFGCLCFVLIPGEQRTKLDAKSLKAIFIGYSTTQKGYKCYVPEKRRVIVSRDVKFMENRGYFQDTTWSDLEHLSDPLDTPRVIVSDFGPPSNSASAGPRAQQHDPEGETSPPGHAHNHNSDRSQDIDDRGPSTDQAPYSRGPGTDQAPYGRGLGTNQLSDSRSPDTDQGFEENDQCQHDQATTSRGNIGDELSSSPTQGSRTEDPPVAVVESPQVLRRSTRIRKDPSNWINTRVYYNSQAIAHPQQATCTLAVFPQEHQVFISRLDQRCIPRTYEEAITSEEWRNAIQAEKEAMIRNQTWVEVSLPNKKKPVSSKWVFTIKYKSNGEVERYKARLVARGFTQTYGEDFGDTFAPVAKLHTVRIVFSLAVNFNWDLWQMDVKNAFLQGELEEEVYMTPPPGLDKTTPKGKVLRLRKAIYGLKQSPRAWYHKLSMTLRDTGFIRSESDHTLFTQKGTRGIVIVLVYVDDIIISGDDKEGIQNTKTYLKSKFDIKDLGLLKYFLGIEVCRSKEGLFLSQRKYALDLLAETGKDGVKPARTPLEDGYKTTSEGELTDQPYNDPKQYRRLVGKLIYLTLTRPDICFAVNQVSQHMQTPKVHHWLMLERILSYLASAPGQGVWMGANGSSEIVGYCDADWAGDREDRRSTTGYCTFVGGNLVTWKTKKQKVVSCSSAEAEYRAMRKLTNELTWIKAVLEDLGIKTTTPITMHCDNQAAIHIASNSVFHERTKHIEVDCHKVRQAVELGVILPCYTRSVDQLADIFTKSASTKVCESIYARLGLMNLT